MIRIMLPGHPVLWQLVYHGRQSSFYAVIRCIAYHFIFRLVSQMHTCDWVQMTMVPWTQLMTAACSGPLDARDTAGQPGLGDTAKNHGTATRLL